jgi:hypothetical protein
MFIKSIVELFRLVPPVNTVILTMANVHWSFLLELTIYKWPVNICGKDTVVDKNPAQSSKFLLQRKVRSKSDVTSLRETNEIYFARVTHNFYFLANDIEYNVDTLFDLSLVISLSIPLFGWFIRVAVVHYLTREVVPQVSFFAPCNPSQILFQVVKE